MKLKSRARLRAQVNAAHAFMRAAFLLFIAIPMYAQTDPWSSAITKLAAAVAGPIAKGFSIIAVVLGGCTLAISDGHGWKMVGSIVLGVGMALGAAAFIAAFFN